MSFFTSLDTSDVVALRAELVSRDRKIAQLESRVDDLVVAVTKSGSARVDVTRVLECARDGLLVASRLTEDERARRGSEIVEQFFGGKNNAES